MCVCVRVAAGELRVSLMRIHTKTAWASCHSDRRSSHKGVPEAYTSELTGKALERDAELVRAAFPARALFLFSRQHPLRAWCIRLMRSRLWAMLVPVLIVGNIVLLGRALARYPVLLPCAAL